MGGGKEGSKLSKFKGGRCCNPVILNSVNLKIFEVVCTLFESKNCHFLTYLTKKFHVFINFQDQVLHIFYTHKENFSICEARACVHYDVIVTSYINGWYLFWYQWKEDIHHVHT